MKKPLQILISLLLTTASFAQTTFTVDGLNYAILEETNNEVEVTGGTFTNPLTIPATVTDPNTTITYTVTTVGNSAFRGRDLTGLVLPNTLTTIAFRAFRNTNNLTSITLPASVEEIGVEAFSFGGLREIIAQGIIPPTISGASFRDEEQIEVTVPEGTEEAYREAGWTSFPIINNNLNIGGQFTVDNIVYEITNNNPNTAVVAGGEGTVLNIPSVVLFGGFEFALNTIAEGAFRFDNNISKVSFGGNITTIESNAFRDSSITEIISNSTTPPALENLVFASTPTKKLTVPIGTEAAYEAAGWTDFLIVNDVFVVGKKFSVDDFDYEVSSTEPTAKFTGGSGDNVLIPDTVTIFDIELTVTTIGAGAFFGPGLGNRNSVTMGENILNIEDNAFRSSSFIQIISKNTVPPSLGSLVFADSTIGSIIVPVGTIEAYTEVGWPASLLTDSTTIELKLKTFLQGAYINPSTAEEDLRNDLQEAALIPLTSTYADERSAARTFDTIQFFSPFELKIVDWIFVEIRDANEPSSVLDSRSLLLKTNGDIVDFTLDSEFTNPTFDQPLVDEYFVVIKHRNHISIRTVSAISSNQSFVNLDFTNDPTLVEGGENALTEVSEGIFAMIAGDFDENGQVQPSDVNDTTAAIGTSVYSNADMDMNGQIQPADVNNLVNLNVGRGVQF